jgi:hypothetical protein
MINSIGESECGEFFQYLNANEPAIRLYLRSGFTQVGEVAEMFKLDGRLFSDTTMAKRIREDQPGDGDGKEAGFNVRDWD